MMSLLNKIYKRLQSDLYLYINQYRFGSVGKNVRVYSPLKIQGHPNISMGDNSCISEGIWLGALPISSQECRLSIGRSVQLGHFNHIYATKSIVIEDNVLTADRVYISDNSHSYEDIDTPIWKQPIKQLSNVIIGEGSWIGENVCIMGASVGKHCVVGANSVVTKDIPDYCVAVGAPARVIRQYCFITHSWERM